MRRVGYFWVAFSAFLSVAILTAVAIVVYASQSLRMAEAARDRADIVSTAQLVEEHLRPYLDGDPRILDSLCKRAEVSHWCRVTVVDKKGVVLADSKENPLFMENHGDRPEIRAALAGDTGMAERISGTMHERYQYAAYPLLKNGSVDKVFRVSRHVKSIVEAGSLMLAGTTAVGLAALLLSIAAAFWLSGSLARPVVELTAAARRIASGDFSVSFSRARTREIGDLADSMNDMAGQLAERLMAATRRKNELGAILSSMAEGLIAVDLRGRLLMVNRAAGGLFSRDPDAILGLPVSEALRSSRVVDYLRELAAAEALPEAEIIVTGRDQVDRIVQMRGTPLRDHQGGRRGSICVFYDVTELRRLENVRRDFVANVSHELRTPLTAIRGFVETLLDGGVDDPADINRFLTIIRTHTNRLDSIIEDLLTLSQLEEHEETQGGNLEPESVLLSSMIANTIAVCGERAAAKNISLSTAGVGDPRLFVVPSLFEQALVNLVDNAVKYSPAGTPVVIGHVVDASTVRVSVVDQGPGIPSEHLPRIFERFYRIDKARSRRQGGTGLGLSIVKHVMKVLGGSVTVESAPGKGSVFTLVAPAVSDQPGKST